jgi:hypothetical protein
MIKNDTKYIALAEEIKIFFQEGIVLSTDVIHFIDSTFSNPSISEFADIIVDESNLERESLMELIFSPDESIQVHLENSFIAGNFEKYDEKKIIDLIRTKKINTHIVFPDSRGELNIKIPDEAIATFVSKLNIHWKPDARVMASLDQMADQYLNKRNDPLKKQRAEDLKAEVTVRMRNKNVDHSKINTEVLCLFLEKADMEDSYFFNCLDFILDMASGLTDNEDGYKTLSQQKLQYCELIRKREEFDSLLAKNNPETLSLQGLNAPFINIEDIQKRITIIDRITLAVYDKIVYCI